MAYSQDTFDKAFISIVTALQQKGLCKNISAVEKYLDIPTRTLHQVMKGVRGIPLVHRSKIQKFFSDRYLINPAAFTNVTAKLYRTNEPDISMVNEDYVEYENGTKVTAGDLVRLRVLETENTALIEKNALLERQIKACERQLNSAMKTIEILQHQLGK